MILKRAALTALRSSRVVCFSTSSSSFSSSSLSRHPPFVYHPAYTAPDWPENHTFAMWKFEDAAQCLLDDGVVRSPGDFFAPEEPIPDDMFLLAHDRAYYEAFVDDTLEPALRRRIGFTQRPSHEALVRRTRLEVAGTLLTARLALEHGIAANVAGGTHHAHRAWGSGYTALNDLAITALALVDEGCVERVAVVDLDVHQGDGTAEILGGSSSGSGGPFFTFSMHCEDNFPLKFHAPHLGNDRSDLDVGLPSGTGDEAFMAALRAHLGPTVLDGFKPDLVLYDAGIDPFGGDRLGKLELTEEGLYRRDLFVISECARRGVPVACVIGGGYDRNRAALAKRHTIVHRAARDAWLSAGYDRR